MEYSKPSPRAGAGIAPIPAAAGFGACYHRPAAAVGAAGFMGRAGVTRDTIGMTPGELEAYLEELLVREAEEAAERDGTTVEQELASPGFAAVRAAASYTIHLIDANNAFIARFLLDRGVLHNGDGSDGGDGTPG